MRFDIYCAESQQDLFARSGEVKDGESLRPRRIAAVLAAVLLVTFLSSLGQQQPCDALATAIGDTIRVSGVVDSGVTRSSAGHWAWFYISENGCDIRVYHDKGDLPWLHEGSHVLIKGRRSEFNNEPQITADSVGLAGASTTSGNRLLLIALVISGVTLSASGVLIARVRHKRTSGDKTQKHPDAEPSEANVILSEAHDGLDEREVRDPVAYSAQDSGRVSYVKEPSRAEDPTTRLRRIKREYPRAYERWSKEEDRTLVDLRRSGRNARQTAETLERQPGAIRSRLRKLDQGDEPLYLHDESGIIDEVSIAERARALRRGEIAFLPMAVSSMSGDAVCVAGLDINTRSWVRLVRQKMYSLNKADSTAFSDRSLMGVQMGAPQVRPGRLDPRGLHTEDRVIEGSPRKLRPVTPTEKLSLLESVVDVDLEHALSTKRSLFLVEPSGFRLIPRDGKQPKIAFETPTTSTEALRSSRSLDGNLVGISSKGCPCNCLMWDEAAGNLSKVTTHNDILKLFPGARIFFALSLTGWPSKLPPEKQKHYLLVAGIHLIGRDQVWL